MFTAKRSDFFRLLLGLPRAFGVLLSLQVSGWPFVERFVRADVLHKFDFLTTNAGAAICFLLFLFPGFPKDYLGPPARAQPYETDNLFDRVDHWTGSLGTYLLTIQGASIRNQQYLAAAIFAVVAVATLLLAYLYRGRIMTRSNTGMEARHASRHWIAQKGAHCSAVRD